MTRNVFDISEEDSSETEGYSDLIHRVSAIANDIYGMHPNDVQELVDELRDAGIGFVELN